MCGWNRKTSKEEAIEHREHRGVDADAERQRQHGDRCHQRPAAERSEGVAKVLQHHGPIRNEALEPIDGRGAPSGDEAGDESNGAEQKRTPQE